VCYRRLGRRRRDEEEEEEEERESEAFEVCRVNAGDHTLTPEIRRGAADASMGTRCETTAA